MRLSHYHHLLSWRTRGVAIAKAVYYIAVYRQSRCTFRHRFRLRPLQTYPWAIAWPKADLNCCMEILQFFFPTSAYRPNPDQKAASLFGHIDTICTQTSSQHQFGLSGTSMQSPWRPHFLDTYLDTHAFSTPSCAFFPVREADFKVHLNSSAKFLFALCHGKLGSG